MIIATLRSGFFVTTCDQSTIGRSLGVSYRHIGISVHENERFYGQTWQNQYPVHKKGSKRGRDEKIKKRYPKRSISRKCMV